MTLDLIDRTYSVELPRFVDNLNDARDNGYDRVCVECGAGITDDTDIHDSACSEYDPRSVR